MQMYALYEITDNGLAFISKHSTSSEAMIESGAKCEVWTESPWEHFQTQSHETWVSSSFTIISEVNNV